MLRAKVDRNPDGSSLQVSIGDALKAAGWSVEYIHQLGKGRPDILAGKWGVNLLMEVKTPKGKLTDDEMKWHEKWEGQISIVRSIEQALFVSNIFLKLRGK